MELYTNMLNVDMGMVFDFQTDVNGRPIGCPGKLNGIHLESSPRFSFGSKRPNLKNFNYVEYEEYFLKFLTQ